LINPRILLKSVFLFKTACTAYILKFQAVAIVYIIYIIQIYFILFVESTMFTIIQSYRYRYLSNCCSVG